MPRSIDAADIAWLHEYQASTLAHFRPRFEAYAPRFAHGETLLTRYASAIEEVIVQGRGHFRAVDEAHNEICVADAILADPSTTDATLLYEPPLPNTDKTIDFVLHERDDRLTLVDVKTIKPQPRDRWDQYERALKEGWLPKNVQFILEQEWQGGNSGIRPLRAGHASWSIPSSWRRSSRLRLTERPPVARFLCSAARASIGAKTNWRTLSPTTGPGTTGEMTRSRWLKRAM